ncbi:MAG TPA: hypothetical protein VK911_04080 [Vicinamibacterales bacterium]|nr:hypothetical protein [Vicinamibacterales bacterium]
MSLDDYISRLTTTITQELQAPIDQALRSLLGEVLAAAHQDRDEAVRGLEAQLATLREDHEAGQARAEAEREGLLEQHAAALTALRQEVTAEVGQAVLAEAMKAAGDEQAAAEQALRAQLLCEWEAAEQRLRADLAREREAAEEALRAELLLGHETAEQALRDQLAREYDARIREAEEAHEQALAALREELTADLGQAVLVEARQLAQAEQGAALAALREEVTAEIGQAVLAEAMQTAREDQAVAEHALRAQFLADHEAAQQALRAQLLADHEAALQALRAQLLADREATHQPAPLVMQHGERVPAPREPAVNSQGLGAAIRQLDEATSLTHALATLLAEISLKGPAAIFLVGADRLRSWRHAGFQAPEGRDVDLPLHEAGPLGRAVQDAAPTGISSDDAAGSSLPRWLLPDDGGRALAVPVSVGGRVVALMYVAADARAAFAAGAASAPEDASPTAEFATELEILARHAGRCLEVLTFARLSAAARPFPVHSTGGDVRRSTATDSTSDRLREEESARRYARLLLSEVKLYNESAVEEGCARRDLLARLGPEIDRARRLYEEKIPALAQDRSGWFDEELVRTLAGGDASMLGQVT